MYRPPYSCFFRDRVVHWHAQSTRTTIYLRSASSNTIVKNRRYTLYRRCIVSRVPIVDACDRYVCIRSFLARIALKNCIALKFESTGRACVSRSIFFWYILLYRDRRFGVTKIQFFGTAICSKFHFLHHALN